MTSWQRFVPLLQKELRETLRDRRTIATLFLMPLLVYPILSLVLQNFLPRQLSNDEPIRFRIVVASSEGLDPFLERIGLADRSLRESATRQQLEQGQPDQAASGDPGTALAGTPQAPEAPSDNPQPNQTEPVEDSLNRDGSSLPAALAGHLKSPEELAVGEQVWTVDSEDLDLQELVSSGEIDLAIRFIDLPENAAQERRRDGLRGKAVELIYNRDSEYSRRAHQYVALRIERFNLLESQFTLAQLRLPRGLSLARVETPLDSTAVSSMTGFATFIPLILIMMTITGAVYPAIDLTAGERERGTLESLVAAPVSRLGVLFAKYVAVWVVAMLTATLNIVSMLTTMWVFQLDRILLSDGITVWLVLQVFLLLALYAIFFSAVLLVLTSIARSFKEAQAYLIPLMVFSLAPGILAMMPELGTGLWLAIVPMVNLVILARDVMQGQASAVFAVLAVITTLLYSVTALAMAAELFGSDAVLYGSQGGWRELIGKRDGKRLPSPAFALLVLALLFPSQFLMLGIMGRLREVLDPLQTVIAIAVGTIVLFLLIPGVLVVGRGYRWTETFALRWPGMKKLTGGVLLGLGIWPFVGLALWALGNAYQWISGSAGSDWTSRISQLAMSQVETWSQIPIPILVLAFAILPAICEEFFFRGLLLQALARNTSFWKAVIGSGLAFGLFHFIVESSVAPLRFVVTSSMGIVLGWVCLKSKSLLPGILLHSINNAILTSVALLRQQLLSETSLQQPEPTKIALLLAVALGITFLGVWLMKEKRRPVAIPAAMMMWGLLLGGVIVLAAPRPLSGCLLQESASVDGALSATEPSQVEADPDLPQVAKGWTLRRFADDDLAHDIHTLTVSSDDEVFVAGPGYIAQLLDTDQDGVADQRRKLPIAVQQGAQGLLVEANWVWWVADRAIWRADLRTNATQRFIALPRTGGEHDFHALRRGDDGYLYFIAGNYSAINQQFITQRVPIASPQHGVLGRISPDGRVRQILVDGMRNSYDFAFDLDHSLLVYDSDDERDSGLPWYRPTILFRAKAGQNIGWVSRCFKQPEGVIGSATVRADTGRGSPTGVATLHSTEWGRPWVGAVAFADWTFGRVYLQPHPTADPETPVTTLVSSRNGAAFAPTDLEFDSQGRLFVSVGGRDTAGSVYVVEKDVTPGVKGGTEAEMPLVLSGVLKNQPFRLDESQISELKDWALASKQSSDAALVGQLLRRNLRSAALSQGPELGALKELCQELSEEGPWKDREAFADLAIWLAMNPSAPKLPANVADVATRNRRVEMLTCVSADVLAQIVNQPQGAPEKRIEALAALALLGSNVNVTPAAMQLLFDDWGRLANQNSVLKPADWLVVLRWVLAAPVPNDGDTSPWDYSKRTRPWNLDQSGKDWEPRLQSTWQAMLAVPQVDAGTLLIILKLEELLRADRQMMMTQWEQWNEKFASQLGPVESFDGLVVLAGVRPPYSPEVAASVSQSLLDIDQRYGREGITIDNNWTDRFNAVGALLLGDTVTRQRFQESNEWNRPSQIHALKLLPPWQQVKPVEQLALHWDQWNSNEVSPEFLANLDEVIRQSRQAAARLPRDEVERLPKLASEVEAFRQRVQEERAAYLAKLKAELGDQQSEAQFSMDELLQQVDWTTGNAKRGEQLYEVLNCQRCHAKAGRLGPSLSGVTNRFARKDLVEAIVDPSKNVNDRYRAILVQTTEGKVLSGIPVYNSTDGMILEDASGKTWQLSGDAIEASRTSDQSLMPDGLMNQAGLKDWADLFQYLKTL